MDSLLLKSIPLFSSLADADLAPLGRLLQSRQIPANQVIFWIGEMGDEMFIVQYGQVRLSYTNEAGQEITLATVGPGDFFGDLSLLDGGPRTATAVAGGAGPETSLWVLDRQRFYAFLEQHPSAAKVMVSTMATRLRENTEKLRGIKNVNQQVDESITPMQRVVDRVAKFLSSGWFLAWMLGFALLWMTVQTILVWRTPGRWERISFLDDPPAFFWLGFLATVSSFLLTVFVLHSQRRQAERDRVRADFEYQVNLKAQLEIMQLHQKIDRLQQMVAPSKGA